ncbi:hypothetical protein KUCAC02_022081 [Chaenocephalus aceratus]|nr:hypothetical protein KUCAC02_022081 [Chaenocephalus aceratus]
MTWVMEGYGRWKSVGRSGRTYYPEPKRMRQFSKNPPTGGGPAPKTSPYSDIIIAIFGEDSPSFTGLSGIDSSELSTSTCEEVDADVSAVTISALPGNSTVSCCQSLLIWNGTFSRMTSQLALVSEMEPDDLIVTSQFKAFFNRRPNIRVHTVYFPKGGPVRKEVAVEEEEVAVEEEEAAVEVAVEEVAVEVAVEEEEAAVEEEEAAVEVELEHSSVLVSTTKISPPRLNRFKAFFNRRPNIRVHTVYFPKGGPVRKEEAVEEEEVAVEEEEVAVEEEEAAVEVAVEEVAVEVAVEEEEAAVEEEEAAVEVELEHSSVLVSTTKISPPRLNRFKAFFNRRPNIRGGPVRKEEAVEEEEVAVEEEEVAVEEEEAAVEVAVEEVAVEVAVEEEEAAVEEEEAAVEEEEAAVEVELEHSSVLVSTTKISPPRLNRFKAFFNRRPNIRVHTVYFPKGGPVRKEEALEEEEVAVEEEEVAVEEEEVAVEEEEAAVEVAVEEVAVEEEEVAVEEEEVAVEEEEAAVEVAVEEVAVEEEEVAVEEEEVAVEVAVEEEEAAVEEEEAAVEEEEEEEEAAVEEVAVEEEEAAVEEEEAALPQSPTETKPRGENAQTDKVDFSVVVQEEQGRAVKTGEALFG